MNDNTILEIKNLTVFIKDHFLVKDVNFSMQHGQCFGIVGVDKSGKTSLIKTIAGSLPISDGYIIVCGKNIKDHPEVLEQTGICLDPPMFFKYQTVFENMRYLTALGGKHNKEDIVKALNKFNLAHKMNTRVLFLSYYEKKLMALALAFLTSPKLLLLDEPFSSLPPEDVDDVKKYITELQKTGTSVIIAARSVDGLENLCEKVIFMANRSVIEILSKEELKKFALDETPTFAFVEVKYPHYAGKLIMENFDLPVKLLGKKVLFNTDEDKTAEIVRFLTKTKIAIYKAGYLSKTEEKVFASLAPYFKEEN